MSKTLLSNPDISGDESDCESTQKEQLNSTPIPAEEVSLSENKIIYT